MDGTVAMLKSMCDFGLLSQFSSDKLIKKYTTDDAGKRFVTALIKSWRNTPIMQEYQRLLFKDWQTVKKAIKVIPKKSVKQPFDVYSAMEFYEKLKKIKRDGRLLLECLEEFNQIFIIKTFEMEVQETYFDYCTLVSPSFATSEIKKFCEDGLTRRHYNKWYDKCY
jgi:hypothetical protein